MSTLEAYSGCPSAASQALQTRERPRTDTVRRPLLKSRIFTKTWVMRIATIGRWGHPREGPVVGVSAATCTDHNPKVPRSRSQHAPRRDHVVGPQREAGLDPVAGTRQMGAQFVQSHQFPVAPVQFVRKSAIEEADGQTVVGTATDLKAPGFRKPLKRSSTARFPASS